MHGEEKKHLSLFLDSDWRWRTNTPYQLLKLKEEINLGGFPLEGRRVVSGITSASGTI